MMSDQINNRKKIFQALLEEVMGPSSQGELLAANDQVRFESEKEARKHWRQANGEEILRNSEPLSRYGVGILFAPENPDKENARPPLEEETSKDEEELDPDDILNVKQRFGKGESVDNDLDISASNNHKPNCIALTFFAALPVGSRLVVDLPTVREDTGAKVNGRYVKRPISAKGKESRETWWFRESKGFNCSFDAERIKRGGHLHHIQALGALTLRVDVHSRPQGEGDCLITVSLRNVTKEQGDAHALYQTYFDVRVENAKAEPCILPYRSVKAFDKDSKSMALLYRSKPSFAIGHGCATDWQAEEGATRAHKVSAEYFPSYEAPSMTSEIKRPDGSPIRVSMAALAEFSDEAVKELEELLALYAQWIADKREEARKLPTEFQETAHEHLGACEKALARMRRGFEVLQQDELAREAFQLTNQAVLLQQRRSGNKRFLKYNPKTKRNEFSEPFTPTASLMSAGSRGYWRAFQIAFLLLSLPSIIDDQGEDRDLVDLIWFPTGGGKTEAYLGLTAFSIFVRRLRDPNDVGVNVLMRYTLRLLTAQQFQRASRLICAMEYLRQRHPKLGATPISAGIWMGGETTPNKREDALQSLKKLTRNERYAQNKFLLERCPWCGAELGLAGSSGNKRVVGYVAQGNTVVFRCSDSQCDFSKPTSPLPVYVIDEDIYEKRPSLVIGTVDKFARLAWEPKVRNLFGLDETGQRIASPPGLVIQDELHLIGGPLGSMVGLYECLVEELCTDRRSKPVKPKIVCSTATTRNYREQVKSLYGRDGVSLFPPPGLDAGDSFFAQYARDEEGRLLPGKLYVGVMGTGYGSLSTTQVRTHTALLQAPMELPVQERDPWWTLMCFCNSLNELGNTLSQFQVDIPTYTHSLRIRQNLFAGKPEENVGQQTRLRRIYEQLELTSRLSNEEVPEALTQLEQEKLKEKDKAVDICLASSIIEVGIDVDRLSLMTVSGQPKTTAQYIQVSGRVGRRWEERPGLVVTIYNPLRYRDRSHYEDFRGYHQRLYMNVEPSSVTPFSEPTLERALHAVMVAYVRQFGHVDEVRSPYPVPEALLQRARQLLAPRVLHVDPDEYATFEKKFEKRLKEWRAWQKMCWENHGPSSGDDYPLLTYSGHFVDEGRARFTWRTPTSMRNVDAECKGVVVDGGEVYA
jgi:hypothetical protein